MTTSPTSKGPSTDASSGASALGSWWRRAKSLLGGGEPAAPPSLELDALRDGYAGGRLTAAAVTAHCLARIDRLDRSGPALRAMITVNPQAMDEAVAVDAGGATDRPLHGVPVVIKDNIEVAGLPVTGGCAALSDLVAARDATVVERLRAAGAVIIGKTSMSEFAWGTWDTENSLVDGPARNPHDPEYATGGSSGGTGAAIAAGYAAMGLGTDTGCSVRAPAAINALVGLRPTHGGVDMDGVMPMNADWDTVGPLASTVRDTAVLFDVMRNDAAASCTAAVDAGVDGARVGVVRHLVSPEDSHPEVLEVFERSVADLAGAGIETLDPLAAGVFSLTFDAHAWYRRFRLDLDAWLTERDAPGLAAILATGRVHPRYVDNLTMLRDWPHTPDTQPGREDMLAVRDRYRRVFDDLFEREGLDALVFPTFRYPPVKNGAVPAGQPGQLAPVGSNNYYASLTGYPALSVPMGWTGAGLPLGLQMLGPAGSEPRLLALAHRYEQAARHGRPAMRDL